MYILSSADETYRRHTVSTTVHHLLCTFDQAGMVRQSKVVVGTEIQYFLAFNSDSSLLCTFD